MSGFVSPGFRSVGFRDIRAGVPQMIPGAIAYYPCDEGSGQILHDYSGNGNHGTLGSTSGVDTNDPQWNAQGLVFGGDDGVDFPAITFADGAPHTGMAVFRWVGTAPTSYVVLCGASTGSGDKIYLRNGTTPAFYYRPSGAGQTIIGSALPAIFDGNYHHIAWALDQNKLCSVYFDGVKIGSGTIATTSQITYNRLGAGTSYTYPWIGEINGFEILPFTLSDSQVAQQYAYEKARLATKGVILP